jgi:hypothetical protein
MDFYGQHSAHTNSKILKAWITVVEGEKKNMFQYFVSEKGQLITETQSIQNARETFFSCLLTVKVLKMQYKQY